MILKLSDLQRSLDYSLATTHGQYRVYVIIGHYCSMAGELSSPSVDHQLTSPVWQAAVSDFKRKWNTDGFSFGLVSQLVKSWLSCAYYDAFFGTLEMGMDIGARIRKVGLWVDGFRKGGLQAAAQEMAGLKVSA